MKRIITFVLILLIVITTACSDDEVKTIININYRELKEMLENKETFILEIMQDGCSYCTAFEPTFKAALTEANLTAKVINISNMTEKNYVEFVELLNLEKIGTPTVIFIKDGVETSSLKRIIGNKDKEHVLDKFKNNGFLTENNDEKENS